VLRGCLTESSVPADDCDHWSQYPEQPDQRHRCIDAGLTAEHPSGWFGSLRMRHFGESPLVEDISARSPAYTTFDLQLGYQHPGKWLLALDTFDLFDAKWSDIEYYYLNPRLRSGARPSERCRRKRWQPRGNSTECRIAS